MCVMFMYFSVCAVPDPKKGPKHKTGADAEDNEGKNPKNPPRALCYNIAYHTEHH